MRIAIGSDEAGFDLKEQIERFLQEQHHEVADFGVHDRTPALYPDVAFKVAEQVAAGAYDRAVLICGTGIGMAICANKVPGVRAAQAHDTYSAERAAGSNNAQVLTMGARVIGPELAKAIVRTWLAQEFEPARSGPKVARIDAYEREHGAKPTGKP